MATELSSGAITNILEAVPGIATVLRSPVADAIVNLSRAGAGLIPFNKKDAHELIRYAVRRGLIRSDEGDRVAAEIEAAPKRPAPALAAAAARKPAKKSAGGARPRPHAKRAPAKRSAARKGAARPKAKKK
jgi:hypothetical protein